MASRRAPSSNPGIPALTVEQKRRRIERLQRCIRELETFDPQKMQKRFGAPEVLALQAAIDEALSAAFGHGTPTYKRYSGASTLDNGPIFTRSDFAAGSTHFDAEDAQGMPESPLKLAAPVQPTLRHLSSFDNFRFRGPQRF